MKTWRKKKPPTMTVGELITRLQEEDPETPVIGLYDYTQTVSLHRANLDRVGPEFIPDLEVPEVLIIDLSEEEST